MRWLRQLHRYAGLAAAAFLLLLAVSGGVLVFKDELTRLRYPVLNESLAMLGAADHASAFAAAARRWPGAVRMVRTPRAGLPAYHVYLEGGEALLHQSTHEIVAVWAWHDTPVALLTELHMHLAAGDFGRSFVGWLGVGCGVMALSGFLLWWPVRRQYRVGSLWPERFSRLHLLRLHRDLGAVTALLILLFAMTGAGVVFGGAASWLFDAVLGGEREAPPPRREATERVAPPDTAMVAGVQAELPAAALVSWSPPAPGNAVHYFRLRQPGETHPYGRSTVHVDGLSGAVLASSDMLQAPPGRRAFNWVYPLHAAKIGGWPYRLLAAATALALAVMCISGFLSFMKSRRR